MTNAASNEQERDRLVKKFAYEYVRFNHDPSHCYLVTDVTDDCMLEIEGMSGQFAPSCFNLAPQPTQEPTTGADGRYCAHHDDDPAHTEECYESDAPASNQQLEPGAGGHVHRFNVVRVPPEFGHSYLRCAYCGLSKHLDSHDASTCELCSRVSAGGVVATTLESQEFYALMQSYRHAGIADQSAAVRALEAVKAFITTATASPAAPKEEARDLIAYKWAETLSEGEQSVLLTSSLRRLRDMINAATTPSPDAAREAAKEIVKAWLWHTPEHDQERARINIAEIIRSHCFPTGGESVGAERNTKHE